MNLFSTWKECFLFLNQIFIRNENRQKKKPRRKIGHSLLFNRTNTINRIPLHNTLIFCISARILFPFAIVFVLSKLSTNVFWLVSDWQNRSKRHTCSRALSDVERGGKEGWRKVKDKIIGKSFINKRMAKTSNQKYRLQLSTFLPKVFYRVPSFHCVQNGLMHWKTILKHVESDWNLCWVWFVSQYTVPFW